MKTLITFSSTPPEENCAQVKTEGYEERAQKECRAYQAQLYRYLVSMGYPKEKLPEDFAFVIEGHPHDFGTYYEVGLTLDDEDPQAWALAQDLQEYGPGSWDDEARKELGL